MARPLRVLLLGQSPMRTRNQIQIKTQTRTQSPTQTQVRAALAHSARCVRAAAACDVDVVAAWEARGPARGVLSAAMRELGPDWDAHEAPRARPAQGKANDDDDDDHRNHAATPGLMVAWNGRAMRLRGSDAGRWGPCGAVGVHLEHARTGDALWLVGLRLRLDQGDDDYRARAIQWARRSGPSRSAGGATTTIVRSFDAAGRAGAPVCVWLLRDSATAPPHIRTLDFPT